MPLVENIINRIINEKFVQYIDGQLVFKEGTIDISGLGQGGDGTVYTPVFAYASAPDGTGFTLENSTTLDYTAVKVVELGTPLTANDFAGLWYHRKGLPGDPGTGTNGTNGEPGGIRMNNDASSVTEGKPGTGKIRWNNATPGSATELYIDEMMGSGADMSGFWTLLDAGWYCLVKTATNFNNQIMIIKGTADIVDNGDWFKYPIQVLSTFGAPFANDEKLVLQFFGGGGAAAAVNEAAVLAAGSFVRHADNGSGGYKFLDVANTEIKATSQVFKLSAFTITGISNLPAANTFPHGTVVRLHQDCFVGEGSTAIGVYLVADATNNIWRPMGRQNLFKRRYGTLAAPTNTLSAAGKFDLGTGGDPVIPAGLLYAGAVLVLRAQIRKNGTTTPTVRANLGTDLSARENNSIVYQNQYTATALINQRIDCRMSFVTTTSLMSTRAATVGGGGAASTFADCSTLINTASAMKLTLEASTLSADTIDLLEYSVDWEN